MYYASGNTYLPKRKVPVTLTTADGEVIEGNLFVFGDQRVTDVLNVDAEFLPFETVRGRIRLVNRSAIVRLVPREVESAPIPRPYRIMPATEAETTADEGAETAELEVSVAVEQAAAASPATAKGTLRRHKGRRLGRFLIPTLGDCIIYLAAACIIAGAGASTALLLETVFTGAKEHVSSGETEYYNAMAAYTRGDYRAALREFRPLAERGIANAQYSLGLMHVNGHGVPKSYADGLKWYRKAALQDHSAARIGIGLLYSNGKGVPRDYVAAHMWFSLGATLGNRSAARHRDEVAEKMPDVDVAEAERRAETWLEKHGKTN